MVFSWDDIEIEEEQKSMEILIEGHSATKGGSFALGDVTNQSYGFWKVVGFEIAVGK